MIPRVIFKPMSLEDNIYIVKWALSNSNSTLDLNDSIVYYFPEINSNNVEEIVKRYYLEKKDIIYSEVSRYSLLWEKYNTIYFKRLCEYLNIENIDISEIEVTVGYIPVCPRDINNNSFSLNVGYDDATLLRNCAHEILHFLWFKKIEELYSDVNIDPASLAWKYSEMIVDPILSSKFINDIFNNKFNERAYDSFYEIKDKDGKYLMDVLKDIYNSDKLIESKIREGFDYICSVLDN